MYTYIYVHIHIQTNIYTHIQTNVCACIYIAKYFSIWVIDKCLLYDFFSILLYY